jgi:hypothetical protein
LFTPNCDYNGCFRIQERVIVKWKWDVAGLSSLSFTCIIQSIYFSNNWSHE